MTRLLTISILISLCLSAFFIRLENFKNASARSIDEIVYLHLGSQMKDNFFNYNTIPYGQQLAAAGRDLPDYFFQPLFKHPPLFPWLVSLSMRIFGANLLAGEYVALLASVLMIPLIYLLASLLYGYRAGLFSAFLLWIDPVSIICSQKVWMDNVIAFFTLLSVVFFVYGRKRENGVFLILSGLSTGLAVNTKYTGILILGAFLIYALFYERQLFFRKSFRLSLVLPFLMLIPWILWNFAVYGTTALERLSSVNNDMHGLSNLLATKAPLSAAIALLAGMAVFILRRMSHRRAGAGPLTVSLPSVWVSRLSSLSVFVFLFFLLGGNIFKSLQPFALPTASWQQGIFSGTPPWFYFGQLIEFSLFYVFSFAALLAYAPDDAPERSIVRWSAMIILLFFIAWGGYQCRYILSAVPFLLILGAALFAQTGDRIAKVESFAVRGVLMGLYAAFSLWAVSKLIYLNLNFSFPHDFCYF